MSSEAMLNIKEVVDRNVQYASIDDLQKKGKQRFKVMKLGQFYSLIERAVANVVERQALDIAEKDRQAIVDESNREFKRLFKERQAELQELQRKEDELVSMRERLNQSVQDLESERRQREELERSSAARAREIEEQLRQELGQIRARTEVMQEGEGQLRQEVQRHRGEAEQARAELQHVRAEAEQVRAELQHVRTEGEQVKAAVQQHRELLERARTEITQQRSEADATRTELTRVTLELESERQRRAALEEAVRSTREHADTVSRDLGTGLSQKESELQATRQELQAVRQELQTEQSRVSEMDQVLRLAKERVEGNTRELEETARSRTQAEQYCRELEAQVAEARAEATAIARKAQEFEARCTAIAQEKGALSEDTIKLQENYAATERARVESLERIAALESQLRTVSEQLAETRARYDSVASVAMDRERVITEKEQLIQELRAEIARLTADRDRLVESSQAEESERLRLMHEQFGKLSTQLQEEKEQHQETMKELLAETRSQKELFSEVRTLREQLDAARAADGDAQDNLLRRLGALDDIQKTLAEGVPGKPGDMDVNDQIQAAIALGMETIKDQINLHVEGVNEKRKKELELKAVEAAGVALDRLFLDKGEVESNVEVVEVRQRKGTGIGNNLAALRAMRATVTAEPIEGEES